FFTTASLTGALAAALIGLAGSAAGQGAPDPADRCLERPGAQPPAAWSDRRKVVHLAVCEWAKFGFPVMEIRLSRADEEDALPAALGLSAPLRTAGAATERGY